ncbi:acetylcholine receptor subunit alpha-like [Eurytemora carolleeae]|uniref:acetylcholine receptor subunit alpha-like n=1 Tax=Eurytemora carolleeae TaxID=1294199 RepID=UPI000C7903C9|nr:acetylcholine receptor subunit alpha-like [Eurytemora carolleeae]|eukprot:XP_023323772.1 acetylcholine receptor subunit alpha-like [Eurytemora affinis]
MKFYSLISIYLAGTVFLLLPVTRGGNPDAKRLYDDLLSNYNKLVRPVSNITEAVTVKLKLKLSQLIAVNLKSQIMTTNLWVEQFWEDYKLQWNPEEYGGVTMLHVPSDHIWRPDIVLYNNADGNFEVTLATKATLHSTGKVEWKPPAIYHSSCEMDVEYFPFDEQTCVMKFGSWTYDGFQVPAIRNVKFYTCCDEPYLDITFNITMRRKTLFYTVNLIIPCMGISFLTILVFYLPSDSGEKVSLSISILLSLTVFFLLLAEIIPPTSLVVPLLGKFVLFTMILDTFSICVTVVVLNVHFRTPQTHTMAPWVRRLIFLYPLSVRWGRGLGSPPPVLIRPSTTIDSPEISRHPYLRDNCSEYTFSPPAQPRSNHSPSTRPISSLSYSSNRHSKLPSGREGYPLNGGCKVHGRSTENIYPEYTKLDQEIEENSRRLCPEIYKALEGILFIAEHKKRMEESTKIIEDWKYVAMVMDRLFLWIFTVAVLVGTAGIILQAPTLYDDRQPIDFEISKIGLATSRPMAGQYEDDVSSHL